MRRFSCGDTKEGTPVTDRHFRMEAIVLAPDALPKLVQVGSTQKKFCRVSWLFCLCKKRCTMRAFYAFWFFFCAGWGYLSATFPSEHSPDWLQAAAALPVALGTSIGLLWLEFRKLPDGRFASRPTLTLKPWNRPMGFVMFIGLTFAFAGFWGVAMSLIANLSSPGYALQTLAMGTGFTGGCYVACQIFPNKFGA